MRLSCNSCVSAAEGCEAGHPHQDGPRPTTQSPRPGPADAESPPQWASNHTPHAGGVAMRHRHMTCLAATRGTSRFYATQWTALLPGVQRRFCRLGVPGGSPPPQAPRLRSLTSCNHREHLSFKIHSCARSLTVPHSGWLSCQVGRLQTVGSLAATAAAAAAAAGACGCGVACCYGGCLTYVAAAAAGRAAGPQLRRGLLLLRGRRLRRGLLLRRLPYLSGCCCCCGACGCGVACGCGGGCCGHLLRLL